MLHKSNSWSNDDCQRDDCIICCSATERTDRRNCKQRSVTYETYCLICHNEDTKKADIEIEKEKEKEDNMDQEAVNNEEITSRKRKRIIDVKEDDNEQSQVHR